MRKAIAFLLFASVLGAPASAREGDLWSLDPASPAEIATAVSTCLTTVTGAEDLAAGHQMLAEQGWKERPFTPAQGKHAKKVLDKRWKERRRFYDDAAEFEADRAADPGYDMDQWAKHFEHGDTGAMIALSQSGPRMFCRIATVPASVDGSSFETISKAVEIASPELAAKRMQTPHGFRWETAEVRISEEYGNGIGGAYSYFPSVFAHFVPALSVASRGDRP